MTSLLKAVDKRQQKAGVGFHHEMLQDADDMTASGSSSLLKTAEAVTTASTPRLGSPAGHRYPRSPPAHKATPLDNSYGFSVDAKDPDVHDWYVEGPGRRVGYDNLTAIDWIFEYTKERQRVRRLLANSHGLMRSVKQLIDASHVWIVLVLTGISIGAVAAAINIASDWLGDIKQGYCENMDGRSGQFYLNRQFCCWGYDDPSKCQEWRPWRQALHIENLGGAYVVEYIFYIIFTMAFSVSAAVLVQNYSVYAKHSGIPEMKTVLGGFVMRHFLGPWTLVTKSLGLCLTVSSGMWVGKEGPFVHLACCCANVIMKMFKPLRENEARKREVFSAAAASGISVAFGAPIGGVLFSLEQLSYYFPDKTMWQAFVCAMVAAVTLHAANPFHTDKIVLYQVTYTRGWHSFELLPFILLGITGGVYGGLFVKLNMFIATLRRSQYYPFKERPLWEVFAVSTLSALVNFPNLFMRAQLSELVSHLFAECDTIGNNDQFGLCKATTAGSVVMISLLVTAAMLGFLLAGVTFGVKIPAGIILPSLAVGALYGRALGVFMELLQKHFPDSVAFSQCQPDVPCITPGTYAIVGAASALAGVTRMTASIVVIMFELTGALTYVLPIMIAVMLAKWIGDAIAAKGIYESWIEFNDYPFLDNKDDLQIPHMPVTNVMTRREEMMCIDAGQKHTIGSLQMLLRSTPFRGFPVVAPRSKEFTETANQGDHDHSNPGEVLLGYISRTEMSYALEQAQNPKSAVYALGPGNRSADIPCHFTFQSTANVNGLDLRPWIDQTPITLSVKSTFQLALSMFQKLGLRYLLFVDRGVFCGMLTKKDVCWILSAIETSKTSTRFVAGAGALRDDTSIDNIDSDAGRGLLHEERDEFEEREALPPHS